MPKRSWKLPLCSTFEDYQTGTGKDFDRVGKSTITCGQMGEFRNNVTYNLDKSLYDVHVNKLEIIVYACQWYTQEVSLCRQSLMFALHYFLFVGCSKQKGWEGRSRYEGSSCYHGFSWNHAHCSGTSYARSYGAQHLPDPVSGIWHEKNFASLGKIIFLHIFFDVFLDFIEKSHCILVESVCTFWPLFTD